MLVCRHTSHQPLSGASRRGGTRVRSKRCAPRPRLADATALALASQTFFRVALRRPSEGARVEYARGPSPPLVESPSKSSSSRGNDGAYGSWTLTRDRSITDCWCRCLLLTTDGSCVPVRETQASKRIMMICNDRADKYVGNTHMPPVGVQVLVPTLLPPIKPHAVSSHLPTVSSGKERAAAAVAAAAAPSAQSSRSSSSSSVRPKQRNQ
jgi:hypothetical protein